MAKEKDKIENEVEEIVKKKGMTIKSIPVSLKKIRGVIDNLKEKDEPLSSAEKFDLKVSVMYFDLLKDLINGVLEDNE